MSVVILDVINDAATEIGDPQKTRISLAQWVTIYNSSNREVCEKAKILRLQDKFTLVASQTKYAYPATMIQMRTIHVSETPDDELSFRSIREIFEDEFRSLTGFIYPTAALPDFYFSTASWFNLVPAVSAEIVGGGCVDHFGLPDRISQTQVEASEILQIPDFAQDYLQRRMVIRAMRMRNRLVEAKEAYEEWLGEMDGLHDMFEDRSDDRRSSLAPRRNRYQGMR